MAERELFEWDGEKYVPNKGTPGADTIYWSGMRWVPGKNPEGPGALRRGFATGMESVKSIPAVGYAMAQGAMGNEEGAKETLEGVQERTQENLKGGFQTRYKLEDVLKDPSLFGQWALEQTGQAAASIGVGVAGALATGALLPATPAAAVGAVATGAAARFGLGRMAAAAVARGEAAALANAARTGTAITAEQATTQALSQVGRNVAMTGALALSSGAQNIPESFTSIFDETGQIRPGVAFSVGALKASLDVLPITRLLSRTRGADFSDKVTDLVSARLLKNYPGAAGALAGTLEAQAFEGLTEGAQALLDQTAMNILADKSIDWFKILEAGAGAAVGVAPFGAAGGYMGARRRAAAGAPEGARPPSDIDTVRAALGTAEGPVDKAWLDATLGRNLTPQEAIDIWGTLMREGAVQRQGMGFVPTRAEETTTPPETPPAPEGTPPAPPGTPPAPTTQEIPAAPTREGAPPATTEITPPPEGTPSAPPVTPPAPEVKPPAPGVTPPAPEVTPPAPPAPEVTPAGAPSAPVTLAEAGPSPIAALQRKFPGMSIGVGSSIQVGDSSYGVNYAVVDAEQVKSTPSSAEVVSEIGANPRWDMLAQSANADQGAPVLDGRGDLVTGNNRVDGIVRAYDQGVADEYRAKLLEEAPRYGISPDAVEAMSKPMLVRFLSAPFGKPVPVEPPPAAPPQATPAQVAPAAQFTEDEYVKALQLIHRENKASTSFLQRSFQMGYQKAQAIMERLEKEGVVTPPNEVGKRTVIPIPTIVLAAPTPVQPAAPEASASPQGQPAPITLEQWATLPPGAEKMRKGKVKDAATLAQLGKQAWDSRTSFSDGVRRVLDFIIGEGNRTTKEHAVDIFPGGVANAYTSNREKSYTWSDETVKAAQDPRGEAFIHIHTHPGNTPFSGTDLNNFGITKNVTIMLVRSSKGALAMAVKPLKLRKDNKPNSIQYYTEMQRASREALKFARDIMAKTPGDQDTRYAQFGRLMNFGLARLGLVEYTDTWPLSQMDSVKDWRQAVENFAQKYKPGAHPVYKELKENGKQYLDNFDRLARSLGEPGGIEGLLAGTQAAPRGAGPARSDGGISRRAGVSEEAGPSGVQTLLKGEEKPTLESVGWYQDNPGLRGNQQWVKDKQAYAEASDPKRALIGSITAKFAKSVPIPTELLASLPGARGEQRRKGESQYDALARKIARSGWDPSNPITIDVNHRGEPYIYEGNTRVAVAYARGIPEVQVDIRWLNGGEMTEGNWTPAKVLEKITSKPATPLVVPRGAPEGVTKDAENFLKGSAEASRMLDETSIPFSCRVRR